MKKQWILGMCAAMAVVLVGCGQTSNQADYIGVEAAKELALSSAGITAEQATFSTVELDQKNGLQYYEVDFTSNGVSYSYDIDALTGVVIEGNFKGDDDSTLSNTQTITPSPSPTLPSEGTSTPNPQSTPTTQNTQTTGEITQEQAKTIALNHAGLSSDQVMFAKVHKDQDDGVWVYDVEFYTSDYKEYDYEIHATTGEILSFDYDMESNLPQSGNQSNNSSTISADQAKQIALGQVPGASTSDIYEFQTDYDDGRMEYEGTIIYDGVEYEFTIDGYSGAIREWEAESWHH